MSQSVSIKGKATFVFTTEMLAIICVGISWIFYAQSQKDIQEAFQNRYASHLLADDLTRLCQFNFINISQSTKRS